MSEKPDVSAIDLGECNKRDFPAAGARGAEGSLRVSIGRRAYDQIRKHVAEDSEHEVCGVMLGEMCKDGSGPWLHITEVIRGEHTASQGAQVTITDETWNHFHKVKDSTFPELKYLGWYHSHPDFGIFLSSMDLFIHENFFNASHQVALVVDPQRAEEGLFCWQAGSAERAESFWVGTDEHTYEAAPEPSPEQAALRELDKKVERMRLNMRDLAEAVRNGPEGGWMQTVLLLGILLLVAYLAFTSQWGKPAARTAVEEMRRQLAEVHVNPEEKCLIVRYAVFPPQFSQGIQEDKVTGRSYYVFKLPLDMLPGADDRKGPDGGKQGVWKSAVSPPAAAGGSNDKPQEKTGE